MRIMVGLRVAVWLQPKHRQPGERLKSLSIKPPTCHSEARFLREEPAPLVSNAWSPRPGLQDNDALWTTCRWARNNLDVPLRHRTPREGGKRGAARPTKQRGRFLRLA